MLLSRRTPFSVCAAHLGYPRVLLVATKREKKKKVRNKVQCRIRKLGALFGDPTWGIRRCEEKVSADGQILLD